MIERNLRLFGLLILLVGSPLTVWALSQEPEPDWWIAFMPALGGITVLLVDLKHRGILRKSEARLPRLIGSTLLILIGIGLSLWGRSLFVGGTTIPFGWIVILLGGLGVIFHLRRSEERNL